MNNEALESLQSKIEKALAITLSIAATAKKHQYRDSTYEDTAKVSSALHGMLLTIQEELGNLDVGKQELERVEDPNSPRGNYFRERHESYGMVSVHRVQGRKRLVGSMIETLPNFISLNVQRSERLIDRSLHTEHFYAGSSKDLVEIHLSTYQWAELLTSLNTTGVPCTLNRVMGVSMDDVPEDVKTPLEEMVDNAKERALEILSDHEGDFYKAINSMKEKVDSLKLSQKKAAEMKEALENFKKFVSVPKNAAAWALERINEDTEKTVSQGKAEIAAALSGIVQNAGLKALTEKLGLTEADITPQLKGTE